jgi:hypothetical protein
MLRKIRRMLAKQKHRQHSLLDDVLFVLPDGTRFHVRDMLRSVEVKGITGSGKSSGSLLFFLMALAAHMGATLLIIAQKPEEREEVQEVFARARKLDKLIIVDKDAKQRTNFFDTEMRAPGADARSMVEFLTVMKESLSGGRTGGGTNDEFWRLGEERMLFNAVEAVRQGTGGINAPAMMDFLSTAPTSPQMLANPELRAAWEKKFHYKTMLAADHRRKTEIEAHDFHVVSDYWANEYVNFDPEPRGNILAGVMNTLHTASTGLARLITSTHTDITPAVFDDGYSVLIDFPYSEFGPTGRYIAGGWKHLTQKHILRRKWKPPAYYNVIICDEFQESVTEMDARYLAQCRSHGGAMLCLTQTIHSEYGSIGGAHQGHHKADSLLANFGTHIYHTVDPKTAQFASDLLGQRRELFINTTMQPNGDELFDVIMGRSQISVSTNESYQPILQPALLQGGLRTGGAANDYCVDAVIIRLGEKFANGENYQFMTFHQR